MCKGIHNWLDDISVSSWLSDGLGDNLKLADETLEALHRARLSRNFDKCKVGKLLSLVLVFLYMITPRKPTYNVEKNQLDMIQNKAAEKKCFVAYKSFSAQTEPRGSKTSSRTSDLRYPIVQNTLATFHILECVERVSYTYFGNISTNYLGNLQG